MADRDNAAARGIERLRARAEEDGGEAAADARDDTATGTRAGGVEGGETALERTGWLTTAAVASPTGLAWLITALPEPSRRPPAGLAATAGVVQAMVPTRPPSTARDATALKKCSALQTIAGIKRLPCRVPNTRKGRQSIANCVFPCSNR